MALKEIKLTQGKVAFVDD
jgi:hypothetical protein